MRNTLVILSALAMMATAMPVSNAAEANEVTIAIPIEGGSLDHSGGYREFDCGGTAPLEWACETGSHTRGGWGYIILGFRSINMPGYTGTLEALLTHSNGEVRFHCSWTNGQWTGCRVVGQVAWPAMGSEFDFRCHSLLRAQALPKIPGMVMPGGIPGGTGEWSCYLGHE